MAKSLRKDVDDVDLGSVEDVVRRWLRNCQNIMNRTKSRASSANSSGEKTSLEDNEDDNEDRNEDRNEVSNEELH